MTGSPAGVRVNVTGPVAEIALANGPLNLVTKELLRALNGALGEVSANAQVRCVIVHGGDAALSMSTVLQQRIYDSSDLREGMSAFFAKREPDFSGR